ncbi:hypothetical protein A5651_07995 [Mycobacterium sp. 1274761.0]|nr:hypothetical protein A5651_07995 [Mycobacterium sp. 1274761.0]
MHGTAARGPSGWLWITSRLSAADQLEAAAAAGAELELLDELEPELSDFLSDELEELVGSELVDEPLDFAASRLSVR